MDAKEERQPFISVVVSTFNRGALLEGCLRSVLSSDYPRGRYEVIVVDDASLDGTEKVFRRVCDKDGNMVYVRNSQNRGVSYCRNLGIERARGEFIAFLDDDCRVGKDWLKRIASAFMDLPDISGIGGSVENVFDSGLSWASYLVEFSSWLPSRARRRVSNIPGCNAAYRKKDILGHGFPASQKGMGFEDSLFNHSLVREGRKLLFDPLLKVRHYKCGEGFGPKEYFDDQRRYALGFVNGGYRVFGPWIKAMLAFPLLNLFCLRVMLVFARCLNNGRYLGKFMENFAAILSAEWYRGKVIYSAIREKGRHERV